MLPVTSPEVQHSVEKIPKCVRLPRRGRVARPQNSCTRRSYVLLHDKVLRCNLAFSSCDAGCHAALSWRRLGSSRPAASGSSLIAATELRLPPALTTAGWRRAAANTGVAPHRRCPSRGVTVRRAAELPRGRVVACVALLRLQSPCAGPRRSVVRQTTSTVAQLLCRGARSEALSSSLIVVVGRRRGAVALLRRRVRTLALLCATRGRARAPCNLIRPTTDQFKKQTRRYNQSSAAVLPRNRARASRAGS